MRRPLVQAAGALGGVPAGLLLAFSRTAWTLTEGLMLLLLMTVCYAFLVVESVRIAARMSAPVMVLLAVPSMAFAYPWGPSGWVIWGVPSLVLVIAAFLRRTALDGSPPAVGDSR